MSSSRNALQIRESIKDLEKGLACFRIWHALAFQEIKQRYRRSVIGPFWITISTGIFVSTMGPLYSALFGRGSSDYLQHLAVSFILWNFISSAINESCNTFMSSEGYIKNFKLPMSLHVFRTLLRNVYILVHNLAIIFIVLAIFPPENFNTIWLVTFTSAVLLLNLFWISLILAVLCARYRDIAQIVSNLMTLLFFVTPVLWSVEMLGARGRFFTELNPLYHFIESVRAPLLGKPISELSLVVCLVSTIVLAAFAIILFGRARQRIPYWL